MKPGAEAPSAKSEHSQTDSEAGMGHGATRTLERVAATMGELGSAPVEFQPVRDVSQGGVLLAAGLLRHTPEIYQLPQGFYGIESIFLLLALMALARIRSIEQLR